MSFLVTLVICKDRNVNRLVIQDTIYNWKNDQNLEDNRM